MPAAGQDPYVDDTARGGMKGGQTYKDVEGQNDKSDSNIQPGTIIGTHGSAARLVTVEHDDKWYHAGGHIATIIATPAAYAPLPFAFAHLGWPAGIIFLGLAGCVTWYTSLLLASLDRHDGHRHVRYCDLAGSIYGRSGYWAVIFFQQVASIGNNITIQIVAGQAMKGIYRLYHPECAGPAGEQLEPCGISLQAWIAIFGAVQLIISQLPDISSLRELNLFCTACTIIFAIGCLGMSIYNGNNEVDRSTISYAVDGDKKSKIFNIMFALGIIAFAFGDTILPEVQATVGGNAKKEMYKGISMGYSILLSSYMIVAIAGYWAFGYNVASFVVSSFTAPTGVIAAVYVFAILQIVGCYQIYCRPTFGFAYNYMIRPGERVWSLHNVAMRGIVTTIYMAIITLICCLIPFFGDFVAFVGAIGFTPMDFILPIILWQKVGRHSFIVSTINWIIVIFYSIIAVIGAIGSVQAIANDVANYSVFADLF
ncbi:hypothetical protein CVIRNUC_006165 [Coccomyxa viridis]|uniref:Amino acid transporter transmembrane domain-containing protein n=1 Tax=Coccomyxa viridis TaxID=1274662 RepID=A0AAV1I9J9_9CHLO|nr:hypothetical protein CVIRNUC_006165 [Coccomyxa viridis]